MSQNLVIILDVTDSSDSNIDEKSFFDRGKECTTRIIERKIMSLEEAYIGIILLGSNKKSDIEILYELEKPSWKMIRNLPNVPLQGKRNLYAALNAGNSLLAKNSSTVKKFENRIILISNLKESTNIDMSELKEILNTSKNNNIRIDVIGCESDLVKEIAEATNGASATFDVAMKELIFYRKKHVNGNAWKVYLTLGSIKIPVEVYKRNLDESILKEWKKVTDSSSNRSKKKGVQNQSENVNINSAESIQGYLYGDKVIPLSKLDKSFIYLPGPESLVIYGFTPSSNISWENLNDNSMLYVLGQNGDSKAQITIKYIAQCLHELNLVGIAKGVKKKDKSPRMYVLMPVFDTDDFACLSMTSVCYKEEIKYMKFPQISNKINCSTEQVDAFKNFIASMDLTDVHCDEEFKTGQTPSPSAQRSLECVVYRAKNPGVQLPEPNDDVLSLFEVPLELQHRAKDSLEKLKSLFVLNIVKKEQENRSTMDNNSEPKEITTCSNMQEHIDRKIYSIGTINPIEDYKMSLKLGKSLDDLAKEMIDAIESLIHSNLNEHLTKALDAIRFFRLECENGGPSYYNNWLNNFKLELADCGRNDIIELINKNQIDIILKSDNVLSDTNCEDYPMQDMEINTDFTHLEVSSELQSMFG